jgi:DNA mismatch endonuclease (patch repair protein)
MCLLSDAPCTPAAFAFGFIPAGFRDGRASCFPKHRPVVFVHGDFWHRHDGCHYATSPSTRPQLWRAKFAANMARDSAVRRALFEEEWRVATMWECALRRPGLVSDAVNLLAEWLRGSDEQIEIGGDA